MAKLATFQAIFRCARASVVMVEWVELGEPQQKLRMKHHETNNKWREIEEHCGDSTKCGTNRIELPHTQWKMYKQVIIMEGLSAIWFIWLGLEDLGSMTKEEQNTSRSCRIKSCFINHTQSNSEFSSHMWVDGDANGHIKSFTTIEVADFRS